jgi:hypothetical protein
MYSGILGTELKVDIFQGNENNNKTTTTTTTTTTMRERRKTTMLFCEKTRTIGW